MCLWWWQCLVAPPAILGPSALSRSLIIKWSLGVPSTGHSALWICGCCGPLYYATSQTRIFKKKDNKNYHKGHKLQHEYNISRPESSKQTTKIIQKELNYNMSTINYVGMHVSFLLKSQNIMDIP